MYNHPSNPCTEKQNLTKKTTQRTWSKSFDIHFDETDMGGVVYFANTFKLAHRLLEGFLTDQGVEWSMWFESPHWAVPIKEARCQYASPLLAGKKCVGEVDITKLSSSSVTFKIQLFQSEKLCAVVKTLHVFVDSKEWKKIDVPKEVKSKLATNLDG